MERKLRPEIRNEKVAKVVPWYTVECSISCTWYRERYCRIYLIITYGLVELQRTVLASVDYYSTAVLLLGRVQLSVSKYCTQ